MSSSVFVARPILPPLNDLLPYLEEIWRTETLTNNGPFHQKLEQALRDYLGVPCAMLFNNGTIALLVALKMMDLPPGSEVITTPLTFAATAHSIAWNGLKPVFADVDPTTLTIDPGAVEKAVTTNTSAILAVHVYGTVCDTAALQEIASRHRLRLIYDAAHAFGTTVSGVPIGLFGDASVFSFHATKLFHTLEGGMISTPNAEDKDRLYNLRNFGIKNEAEVVDIGINGKMNEVQASIGLLNLRLVHDERIARAELRSRYNEFLNLLPGIRTPVVQEGVVNSQQYYPLVIDPEIFGRTRDNIYDELKACNIFSRKYFHPICTDFEPYKDEPIVTLHNKPYVERIKSQVLCLPFHSGVVQEHLQTIRSIFAR